MLTFEGNSHNSVLKLLCNFIYMSYQVNLYYKIILNLLPYVGDYKGYSA